MTTSIRTGTLETLVGAAVRAPSSHNTQPWLFRLGSATIELYADRTRALAVNDPHDRELVISCGAALFNLVVAARHHGLEPSVTCLPDIDQPDLLAVVGFEANTAASPDRLVEAIDTRRTTRRPFADDTVPDGLAAMLTEVAAGHGAMLRFVDGDDRLQLADLVAEGDRAQFADPRWRRELASWMHPRRHGEGLVVPELVGLVTRAVVSTMNLGRSTGGKDHELATAAPLVGVLSTDRDDTAAWLAAGQALQHVLLVAAHHDIHAGYLNQPCQVDFLRGRLQQLDRERRYPQVVVRLGRLDDPPPATPRRPVESVLVEVAGDRVS